MDIDKTNQWQRHTLCCRYLVAHFARIPTTDWESGSARQIYLEWAVAIHTDAQRELLGAWLVPREGADRWSAVLGDLWTRGAEHIEWAFASGPADAMTVARGRIPSIGHWLEESHPAPSHLFSSSRVRRVVASTRFEVQRLQAAVLRSARRAGGRFASPEAAVACVERHWRNLERHRPAAPIHRSRSTDEPHVQGRARAVVSSGAPAP